MRRVGEVCKPDIDLLCATIEAGEGSIVRCLKQKQKALSAPCQDAIEETGIDVK